MQQAFLTHSKSCDTNTGDIIQDVALARLEGKAFFTKEIESALLEGWVDLAVHSLKDLPAEMPDGRIVFTSTRIGTFEEYHNPPSRALFVMNADGTDVKMISTGQGVTSGGYFLARTPDEILLSQIVSAVDGPIVAGDFGEPHTDGACDHEGQCVLLALWAGAGDLMRDYLMSFTLDRIAAMSRGEAEWPASTDQS